jgi:hypothetical protein
LPVNFAWDMEIDAIVFKANNPFRLRQVLQLGLGSVFLFLWAGS